MLRSRTYSVICCLVGVATLYGSSDALSSQPKRQYAHSVRMQENQIVSFDVIVPPSATVFVRSADGGVELENRRGQLYGRQQKIGSALWQYLGSSSRVRAQARAEGDSLGVDIGGKLFHTPAGKVSVIPGRASDRWLVTPSSPVYLLAHRVAWWDSQTPLDRCLSAVATNGVPVVRQTDWACGALSGSLWEVFRLTGADWAASRAAERAVYLYNNKAMQASVAKTHDVGSIAIDSLLPLREACRSGQIKSQKLCGNVTGMITRAVSTLTGLSSQHSQGVLIRRSASSKGSETIVDSLMNLQVLRGSLARRMSSIANQLAAAQARWVAENLVLEDGSTFQAARFNPQGELYWRGTIQGKKPDGIWSRGQAWAINGLAESAYMEHSDQDKKVLAKGEMAADFFLTHLPVDGLPRWDLTASLLDQIDLSAATIAARGMGYLALECKTSSCQHSSDYWQEAGCNLLQSYWNRLSVRHPLGRVYDQVQWYGGGGWQRNSEIPYTALYAFRAFGLLEC